MTWKTSAALLLAASSTLCVAQQEASSVAPSLVASPVPVGAQLPAPWRVALLPRQKLPVTHFEGATLDGERVLRVSAWRSYGSLLHPTAGDAALSRWLQWRWRVDRGPDNDPREKSGDDADLKVCALYDWPRERMSIADRVRFAAAEGVTGEALPTATLCYLFTPALPPGTAFANAYTRRVRMIVIAGQGAEPGRWLDHRRDLHADFRRSFADEWREGDIVPPLLAIAIGADTDNTQSEGLAYVRELRLTR